MTTYTLKVAFNGSETDSHDSASWTTKIANIRMSGGGGTWFRPATPLILQADIDVPASRAGSLRTVTVGMEGPFNAATPTAAYSPSAGTVGRTVFHGTITGVRGAIPSDTGLLRITAVSEMSGLLNRVPQLAADLYDVDGPRAVLTKIETALGETISGQSSFPEGNTDTHFWLTLEATKRKRVGEIMQAALGGTGVNLVEEWSGAVTAPVLRWRPDFFYVPDSGATINTTPFHDIQVYRPWLAEYLDWGISFDDFAAKVRVTGVDNTTVAIYGWARLSAAGKRTDLSQKEVSVAGYNSYTTDCKTAAETLLNRLGNPEYSRMVKTRWRPDLIYDDLTSVMTNTIEDEIWYLATARPGDYLTAQSPFDGGTGDHQWPAAVPSDTYDDLDALWNIDVVNNGTTVSTSSHVIRYIEREWDPASGWIITTGAWPAVDDPTTSAASDKDSGPY